MGSVSDRVRGVNMSAVKQIMIALIVLLLIYVPFNSRLYAANEYTLTKEELTQIDQFVAGIDAEQGVGQFFMINLPMNYIASFDRKNWRGTDKDKIPIHKKLIEHGFGSVLLQKNNFDYLDSIAETEEERINLITGFVKNLQYRAISKNNKGISVPLFIAVDFEGPLVNTIQKTLIAPPPALTLATTQDKALIEETGKIVGYQLANSGINMLLGPVLDIDKTTQGNTNRVLRNRSFSSEADGVITAAAYYTKGLREAGLTVIGKHFPGLGFVNGDPHNKIVSFQGTADDLNEHLRPYNELKPLLNGIMTSHVFLPFLANKEPATFNKAIVQFLRKQSFPKIPSLAALDYDDKLVLSDDLGMQAVIDYANEQGQIDYADMAIQAVEAGHDIVMFAKVVDDKKGENRKDIIRISELIKVKKALAVYLGKAENKQKYRAALKRIMYAKAASYKLHGGEIKHFIAGNMNKVIHSQLSVPDSVKGHDGVIDYDKVKQTYENIIEKSYLTLNGKLPYIGRSSHLCIFTPEKYQKHYQGLVGLYRKSNVHFSQAIHNETDKRLTDKIKKIEQHINDNQCSTIFVVANNGLNIDRVINIINYLKKTEQTQHNVVLLLHQNPIALPEKVFAYKNLTVMGAFTQHDLAYDADIKAIKNDLVQQDASLLTIAYNDNPVNLRIQKPDIATIKFDYTTNLAQEGKVRQQLVNEHRQVLAEQKEQHDKEIEQLSKKLLALNDKLKNTNNNSDKVIINNEKETVSFYKEILLLLIIITGFIIILYVTDKAKSDMLRVTNSKDATFILLKNVLVSPKLLVVILFFTLVIFLFIAHLNDLPLHQLLGNW